VVGRLCPRHRDSRLRLLVHAWSAGSAPVIATADSVFCAARRSGAALAPEDRADRAGRFKMQLAQDWSDFKMQLAQDWSAFKMQLAQGWWDFKMQLAQDWSDFKVQLAQGWWDFKMQLAQDWSDFKVQLAQDW